jgi:thioredoxin-like negative regulator of GroEL
MSGANPKRLRVVRPSELVGIFVVFSVVLYLLYPKGGLKEKVLAETRNYDLTMIYLQNMLRIDPSNIELTMALAKSAVRSGKLDLALKLLELLERQNDPKIRVKVLALHYRVLQQQIAYVKKEPVKKKKLETEAAKILKRISQGDLQALGDRKYWYWRFLERGYPEAALKLANLGIRKGKASIYWAEQCFYLAERLHRDENAQFCLDRLLKEDQKRHEFWLKEAYYFAKDRGKVAEALRILDQLAALSPKWQEEKARYALERGAYREAASLYRHLAEATPDRARKRRLYQKALGALLQGHELREAVRWAKEIEERYLDDPQMTNYLLKLYLQAGDLEAGAQLSEKLMQRKGIR